jgi:hypothetical protein
MPAAAIHASAETAVAAMELLHTRDVGRPDVIQIEYYIGSGGNQTYPKVVFQGTASVCVTEQQPVLNLITQPTIIC